MTNLPNQNDMHKYFNYDPETGIFTNKINRGPNALKDAVTGSLDAYGYYTIGFKGRNHKAHRLAWLYVTGEWPKGDIDHINGAKGDNRFCNLRVVTRSQNVANAGAQINNYLGVRGIYPDRNSFRAEITRDGIRYRIGWFKSIGEAVEARRLKLMELDDETDRATTSNIR